MIQGIISQNTDKERLYASLAENLCQKLLDKQINGIYRTIPGVMNQIVLYEDQNIEVRVHIFSEESNETYIHNHTHPFITFCLEGGYVEKIW